MSPSLIVLVTILSAIIGSVAHTVNALPPESASSCGVHYGIWPMPHSITCECGSASTLKLDPNRFRFKFLQQPTPALVAYADKMRVSMFDHMFVHTTRGPIEPQFQSSNWTPPASEAPPSPSSSCINTLVINITGSTPATATKTISSDESYRLEITGSTAAIIAPEIWGGMYGLTTFTQLVAWDNSSTTTPATPATSTSGSRSRRSASRYATPFIACVPVVIVDTPRYPWRGLLVDTANHFIPVKDLLTTIDALAMNKMNVFHWHIVDSYSYPMVSQVYPQLSRNGAWAKEDVYTVDDVTQVIEHANNNGVRVVAEFDTPGHCYSLGLTFPNITVSCDGVNTDTDIGPINIVPIDPSNNFTYTVVEKLLGEFASRFQDQFLHVGGDELQTDCWEASKKIKTFMAKTNMKTMTELQSYFEKKMLKMVTNLNKTAIVWADSFQAVPESLPPDTVIEVWQNMTLLNEALLAGHDTLLALGWYLDRQQPVDNESSWFWIDTWEQMYNVDPDSYISPTASSSSSSALSLSSSSLSSSSSSASSSSSSSQHQQRKKTKHTNSRVGRLLGGEANMWSEQVSSLDIHQRVWPRACAVAERLWSSNTTTDVGNAASRLAKHRCRMGANNVPAGPIWSDFCSSDVTIKLSKQADANDNTDSAALLSRNGFGAIAVAFWSVATIVLWIFLRCKYHMKPSSTSSSSSTSTSTASAALLTPSSSLVMASSTSTSSPNSKNVNGNFQHPQDDTIRVDNGINNDSDSNSNSNDQSKRDGATPIKFGVPVKQRIKSLDVFRGLNIALMVFVDMVGSSFPEIHHTPWNGIRLADFVMPFFDFMVGVSLAISFKKLDSGKQSKRRIVAFKKATIRFFKIFIIGVLTQGGISPIEFNLSKIRIMGILQRVAVCYYVSALMEIFLPRAGSLSQSNTNTNTNTNTDTGVFFGIPKLLHRYRWHWVVAVLFTGCHTAIMYGVDVTTKDGVHCGAGNLTVVCNAATFIDLKIFGEDHMYFPANGGDTDGNDMTYQRLPECSGCSPGKCKPRAGQKIPDWCNTAPFDPEGVVSSLNAVITTMIGLHCGHVVTFVSSHRDRIMHWMIIGVLQIAVGLALHFSDAIAMNTDLYSISYLLVSGGAAAITLASCYWVVDFKKVGHGVWMAFMMLGMNAIMMYLFMEGGIIEVILTMFYVDNPDSNLDNVLWPSGDLWGDDDTNLPSKASHNVYVFAWTIMYIWFWTVVAKWMYLEKVFIKL